MPSAYALRDRYRLLRIVNKILITLKSVKNLGVIARDYLKLSQGKAITLKFYSGLKVKVRSNTVDAHEAVTVISGQEYPFKVLAPLLNPRAVVIDVGAHIGSFTLYLKSQLPEAKIYCFEPARSNFDLLLDNISFNNLSGVKAIKLALAGKTGPSFLKTDSLDNNAYSLGSSGEPVLSIDLDSFFKQEALGEIDLIKMDCEGAEYEILSNAKKLKQVKSLILEYHRRDDNFNDTYLVNLLASEGFTLGYRRDRFDHSQGILYFKQA